ncbi:hypothetical protein Ping_0237 [Psychromonas ingrahamii 37]|uniref:Uncharacterized protein n=1 Tax=Psychromonas ingrahamii (strain DSM 17664 / CCUG 51855 / 37) TaxID=357804 RepID=A1SRI9_PSYIN|nr:hypothetical protein [Psychromonas ingrahamii]ABM02104.1 hypothetical protein Ping_0237 [Psychromonas ingrahamii 37]
MKLTMWFTLEMFLTCLLVVGKVVFITTYLYTGYSIWLLLLVTLLLISLPIYYGIYESVVGEEKVNKIESKIGKSIHLLIAFIIVISAVCVFVFQTYTYLKSGVWLPLSVIDGFSTIGFEWAKNPTDWIGLWELVDQVPLSVGLFLIGLYVFQFYD